jgi:predicted RNA polymerase sigma factor
VIPFEDFCRSEYGRVFGALYVATGSADLAQEATQEAFQRAFARWRRSGEEQWATGWVVTTALNHKSQTCTRDSEGAGHIQLTIRPTRAASSPGKCSGPWPSTSG